MNRVLRVAWITFFPVEWLEEAPAEIRAMPKGHAASWQRVLMREFQKNPALELHVFAIRKTFTKDVIFRSGNATFYCLKCPGSVRAPSLFWFDTLLLRPHLKRISPHLIHAWGTEQAAGLVASRTGIPYILTMQGILTWLSEFVNLNRYEKLMALLERCAIPRASQVTVEAGFAVDYLRRKWPGPRVTQVEHAPDPTFLTTPRKNDPSKIRFLAMGGINELKGADLLLRGLAELQSDIDFECVAIGASQTPLMERLRSELDASLFEKIRFKTGLSAAEVAQEMANATMLLYPTRGDTSPNSVKEAVVHGLPVVSAKVGGIPEYVYDSENGVLFEPNNLGAFVDAMKRALRHPLFSRGVVEAGALTKARQHLSPAKMADAFLRLYEAAISAK